jgi:hypothetical protein
MAIAADISATLHRDRTGAAIATRRKTIVAHSMEPPNFTTKAGSASSANRISVARRFKSPAEIALPHSLDQDLAHVRATTASSP